MGPRDPAGSWALKWRSRDRCGWSRCHLRALGVAAGQASRGSYSVWVLPLPTRFSQASEPRGSPQAGCGWQGARWRASRRVGLPFAPLHRPLTPAPGSASSVVGGASACPVVLIESQGGSRGGSFSDPALTPAAALPALGRSFPPTGQLHCGPPGPSSGRTALPVRQEGRLLRGAGPGGGAAPGALAARALSSRRVLRTPALTPCFSFPLFLPADSEVCGVEPTSCKRSRLAAPRGLLSH